MIELTSCNGATSSPTTTPDSTSSGPTGAPLGGRQQQPASLPAVRPPPLLGCVVDDRYKTNIFSDPKFEVLQNHRGDILGTLGYPRPPTYEAIITQTTFVLPDMVQKAVTTSGDAGAEAAIAFAAGRLKSIYKGVR